MARMIVNHLTRRLNSLFGGMFALDQKRPKYYDSFGYKDHLEFWDFYHAFERHPLAYAGVKRLADKTWQDYPSILEDRDAHDETQREADIREAFERLQFWTKLHEADWKGRVGEYGAIIFRFADGRPLREPVQRVPGGLQGLVEIIPVYQEQLKPTEWDLDETSIRYGQPTMYNFHESAVDPDENKIRHASIHWTRVHIWSRSGTVHGESVLKPGYNALVNMEKIMGSSGEGFLQMSRNNPIFDIDPEANLAQLAQMMGVDEVSDVPDKLDEVVGDYRSGYDNSMMTQGFSVSWPDMRLEDPENHFKINAQAFAATLPMSLKGLLGSEEGKLASDQDAQQDDATIMTRRNTLAVPNVKRIIDYLIAVGVMPSMAYRVEWSDLTESSIDDKTERAVKMQTMNKDGMGTGEGVVFTRDEIRETMGYEPLEEDDASLPADQDPEEDE